MEMVQTRKIRCAKGLLRSCLSQPSYSNSLLEQEPHNIEPCHELRETSSHQHRGHGDAPHRNTHDVFVQTSVSQSKRVRSVLNSNSRLSQHASQPIENLDHIFEGPIPSDVQQLSTDQLDIDSTRKQKKTRGPTRCLDLLKMQPGQRLQIASNEFGQPVGPNASKLTRYLGTLVRNPEKAPLLWNDWRAVPQKYKDHMWDIVQDKFDIGDVVKDWVMKSLGTKWRNYKCSIKKKFYNHRSNNLNHLSISDKQVDPTHWKDLVNFWDSEEGKLRSSTNKMNRTKQIGTHVAGSKSFATIREEMRMKKDDLQNPSLVELYMKTHIRKDGQPVDNTSANVMVQLKEHLPENVESNIATDEKLCEILGEGRHGRVRLYGLGPSPSDVYGPKPSRAEALQMVEEIKKTSQVSLRNMSEQVSQMRLEQENLKRDYEERLIAMQEKMKEEMQAQVQAQVQAAMQIAHINTINNQTREAPSPLASSSSSHLPRQGVQKHKPNNCVSSRNLQNIKETLQVQKSTPKKGRQTKAVAIGDKVLLQSFQKPNSIVAHGILSSRDPYKKVGHQQLGAEFWELVIFETLVVNEPLVRPYGTMKRIGDAIGARVAWPSIRVAIMD